MTIALSPELEGRLKAEADRRGMKPDELAQQILTERLSADAPVRGPNQATLDLLARWNAEDATGDPAEIARRTEEAEEFMQNLARNRIEMEGPNARKLWR